MSTRAARWRGLVVAAAGVLLAGTGLVACGGGDSAEDFCAVGDELNSLDPTSGELDADELQQALDDAVDAAPDEIKDDVELLRSTFEDVDFSDPEALSDPDMLEKLSDPKLADATEHLQTYTDENCDSGG